MKSLNRKVIVITGANGLLGKVMQEYLSSWGASVVGVDISYENESLNSRIADTTDEHQVDELIKGIVRDFGKIDGWVNNAYPRTEDWGDKFEFVKVNSWKRNIDMHLNGYFICSKFVLEQMKEQHSGSLINMASIYGMVGPDFSIYDGTEMSNPVAYSAIKGGLISLTRYLASYFGPYQIRVNAVSPGGIFDNQPKEFLRNYEKKVPLRRLGRPEEIAPGVAFLMSDESKYITGHNLVIDGGWTSI